MKRLYIILILFISWQQFTFAQYFPLFSQYVNNGLVINPAYTGSREVLSINLLYRNQMTGFTGAPVFQTVSVHAPLKNPKLALGFLLFNEKSGPITNTNAFISYAYKVNLGFGKLNFGIQAGAIYGSYNWNSSYFNDQGDQSFSNTKSNYVLPNIGAGIYYYSHKFFAGMSVPYFLSYKEKSSGDYTIYHNVENYNFLFSTGYLLRFSKNFKLKPTALVKYYMNAQAQGDLNLNIILLDDKLWFGGGYRSKDAITGMFDLQLNPQFRLSYVFEYASRTNSNFNSTSHEIGIRYEFAYKLKAFNPRYF